MLSQIILDKPTEKTAQERIPHGYMLLFSHIIQTTPAHNKTNSNARKPALSCKKGHSPLNRKGTKACVLKNSMQAHGSAPAFQPVVLFYTQLIGFVKRKAHILL